VVTDPAPTAATNTNATSATQPDDPLAPVYLALNTECNTHDDQCDPALELQCDTDAFVCRYAPAASATDGSKSDVGVGVGTTFGVIVLLMLIAGVVFKWKATAAHDANANGGNRAAAYVNPTYQHGATTTDTSYNFIASVLTNVQGSAQVGRSNPVATPNADGEYVARDGMGDGAKNVNYKVVDADGGAAAPRPIVMVTGAVSVGARAKLPPVAAPRPIVAPRRTVQGNGAVQTVQHPKVTNNAMMYNGRSGSGGSEPIGTPSFADYGTAAHVGGESVTNNPAFGDYAGADLSATTHVMEEDTVEVGGGGSGSGPSFDIFPEPRVSIEQTRC
jgi:hypothetical protein